MRVRDVMTKQVCTIGAHESIVEAARQMKWFSVGALPVTREGQVIGMLTDRDIVTRAVAEGRASAVTTAETIMTHGVHTIDADCEIGDALLRMEDAVVRRLVVIDADQRVLGVVSYDDLTAAPEAGELDDAEESEPRPALQR